MASSGRHLALPLVAAVFTLLLIAPPQAAAQAAVPSILGTFTGGLSGTNTSCQSPVDDGPFTEQITLVVDTQIGNNFDAVGIITSDGSVLQMFGTIQADGSVSASFDVFAPDGTESVGSLNGTLAGDVLTFSFSGSDVVGDTCTFTGSASLSRGTTVVPTTAAPNVVTTLPVLTEAIRTMTNTLTTRIWNLLRGRGTGVSRVQGGLQLGADGLAAGAGEALPLGVWGSYTRTNSKDDFVSTAFKAHRNLVMGGVDVAPTPDVVVGVAFGYDDNSVDTRFNAGEQDITALTVAPYVGGLINDTFSYDFSVGYSNVSNDQSRTAPGTGTRILSDVDSYRVFAAGNVTASRFFGNVLASGHGGMLWARESQDGFVESDGTLYGSRTYKLGQFRVGGELAYTGAAFEPYARGTYQYDFSYSKVNFAAGVPSPGNDRDDFLVGLGVRYFGDDGLSGVLEYSTILGRDHYDEDNFNVSLRWEF